MNEREQVNQDEKFSEELKDCSRKKTSNTKEDKLTKAERDYNIRQAGNKRAFTLILLCILFLVLIYLSGYIPFNNALSDQSNILIEVLKSILLIACGYLFSQRD